MRRVHVDFSHLSVRPLVGRRHPLGIVVRAVVIVDPPPPPCSCTHGLLTLLDKGFQYEFRMCGLAMSAGVAHLAARFINKILNFVRNQGIRLVACRFGDVGGTTLLLFEAVARKMAQLVAFLAGTRLCSFVL